VVVLGSVANSFLQWYHSHPIIFIFLCFESIPELLLRWCLFIFFFSYLLCDHCILLMRLNYEISIMIQWDLIIFILT
jgi:hypothetical protein